MLCHANSFQLLASEYTDNCYTAAACLHCSVLKVELSSLGGMKTLPYIVMFLMSNVGGLTGDRLILRSKYSVAAARKAVNTMGGWSAGWLAG